jgi:Condensation domain
MDQVLIHFAGEGSGVAELTWGQRELWGAMQRQGTWMPLPIREPLPAGTTVEDMAEWLRYVMSRHQTIRTKLAYRPDGPPRQVVHGSGDIAMDVIEAGDEDPAAVAQRTIDRYVDQDFDFARDWPVDMAVILRHGVPVIRVFNVCHMVTDAFGAAALIADLARRDAAPHEPPPPLTATEPLAQAAWQCSPAGQRHSDGALRHWAEALREMPARRFPPAVDRGEPRHSGLTIVSPAVHLAVCAIRHRTGANGAQVILTLFLIALTRVTGVSRRSPGSASTTASGAAWPTR